MPAGNWIMYDSAKLFIGDGTIDLDSHTFNVALFTSTYSPDRDAQNSYNQLTDEVAAGGGYATGGVELQTVTWTETGGIATWTSANPAWTGTGAGFTFKYAVIYDVNSVGTTNALVCYCNAETSGSLTVGDGQTLTIQMSASGILTLSGATS